MAMSIFIAEHLSLLRRRVWQYAIRAVLQDAAARQPRWRGFAEMRARQRQRRAYQRAYLRRLDAQREGVQAGLVTLSLNTYMHQLRCMHAVLLFSVTANSVC
jgi:hypothetical protein